MRVVLPSYTTLPCSISVQSTLTKYDVHVFQYSIAIWIDNVVAIAIGLAVVNVVVIYITVKMTMNTLA